MNLYAITEGANAIIVFLAVGLPVCFVFFSPRHGRFRRSLLPPLLAILCTVSAIEEFHYTLLSASSAAHTRLDPATNFASPPGIRMMMFAVFIVLSVWLAFFPPVHERTWRSALCQLLAIIGATVATYGLFFIVAYAAIVSYLRTDPPMVLDGPTLIHRNFAGVLITVVSISSVVLRIYFGGFRRSEEHDSSLPTNGNV